MQLTQNIQPIHRYLPKYHYQQVKIQEFSSTFKDFPKQLWSLWKKYKFQKVSFSSAHLSKWGAYTEKTLIIVSHIVNLTTIILCNYEFG